MSFKHLPPASQEAVLNGRAIVFLLNWPLPELPSHLLTVVATLDDEKFYVSFLNPDYDGELAALELPPELTQYPPELSVESDDARAIHRLWHRWHSSLENIALNFARDLSRIAWQLQVNEALDQLKQQSKAASAAGKPSKRKSRQKAAAKRVRR